MHSQPYFYTDPYARQLDAVVHAVEGEWITLDRTIFYPQGGGQPGDTGTLGRGSAEPLAVLDTRKGEGGAIRHRLATAEHGLSVGDALSLTLDWDRRHRHMRMHTCLHLLGSLIDAGVTGGSVGADKSRLDFDAGEQALDKAELSERLRTLIEGAYPVMVEWVDEALLDEQPELVRTMSVSPPRGVGTLRMIRVTDVDYQPCGGTHVANTAEIGRVRVAKIENKGKRNRRVQIVFD